ALRLGRWFRAISLSVIEGMLAGIGLVLIAGQLYAAAGLEAPATGVGKVLGLPGAAVDALGSTEALASLAVGTGTVVVMVLWHRGPGPAGAVPGALTAVLLATAVTLASGLPVATVEVRGLFDAVQPPDADAFGSVAGIGVLGTVVAFTLIASAESLFSA